MLPLLELRCRFMGFARYEDNIIIRTCIKEYTGTRLNFSYQAVRAEDGRVLAEGETLHCWTGKDLKPVNIKKYMPGIYELIENAAKDN